MTDISDPLVRYGRAAAAAEAVIAGVKPDQLGDPTPCPEWTVRQLINHLVGGTAAFIAMMSGTGPVDRQADHLGTDPARAFRSTVDRLRSLFAAPGALEREVASPFGHRPASILVHMRVAEMMVHGWDVARATGQPTDLDPELAGVVLESFRSLRASGAGGDMFGPPQPAPEGATVADQLAALTGRPVSAAAGR